MKEFNIKGEWRLTDKISREEMYKLTIILIGLGVEAGPMTWEMGDGIMLNYPYFGVDNTGIITQFGKNTNESVNLISYKELLKYLEGVSNEKV
jgi:hypothetical protein